MKKIIAALLAAALGSGACLAAGSNGRTDILDPIYDDETAAVPLPENFYVKEKDEAGRKMIFASKTSPSMVLSVVFIPVNGRPLQHILAENMYKYRRAHSDVMLTSCQTDPALKNFASYAFTCIKNQDSTVAVVMTQFEDGNDQPSDFIRVMTVSAKSGDMPASDEIGEMINHANYNLKAFDNFNIPQKTVLKHHIEDLDMDLQGLEMITGEGPDLWARGVMEPPMSVESMEITDKGMKYVLKMPKTNEKFIATMYLSDNESQSAIISTIRSALEQGYHNCKEFKEVPGVETASVTASCTEGDMKVNIRRISSVEKYEYKLYEVITGTQELLDALFAEPTLSKQLSEYLYSEFFNREILLRHNNIFDYIASIDAGTKSPTPVQFIVDKSTVKSLAAAQAIPGDSKDGAKAGSTPASSSIIKHDSNYDQQDYKFVLIAGAAGIAALSLILLLQIRRQKEKAKQKDEEKKAQEEQEKQEQEKAQASPLADSGDDLLMELEAARMARKREMYQQQRDAENLAKELEEKRKNMDDAELQRRKASLQEFSNKNAPDAIAAALSAPKETVAESNLKANEMIKSQRQEEFEPAKPAAGKPAKKEKPAEAKKPAPAKPAPAPAQEDAEYVQEELIPEEPPLPAMDEAERQAEAERRRKEEEMKAKTNALLMKMKKGQKSDLESREKEPEKPAPAVSTAPSRTFTLQSMDAKPKKPAAVAAPAPAPAPQPAPVQEEIQIQIQPQAQQQSSFFAGEDMVQPEPAVQVQPQQQSSFFAGEDMVQPEPAVQAQPQQQSSFFAGEEMVQPEPAAQVQTQGSFFAGEEMVQPEPAAQAQTQGSFFAGEEMVQPEPAAQPQTQGSFFAGAEVIQPEAAAPSPKAAPAKSRSSWDPLEELARKSKKIEPQAQEDEFEISLEDAAGDISLEMFANDLTPEAPNQDIPDADGVMDLSGGENILDLSSLEEDFTQTAKPARRQPAPEPAAPAPEPAVKPEAPAPAPKKRSTKKIRKFNLGSLSVSLTDKE